MLASVVLELVTIFGWLGPNKCNQILNMRCFLVWSKASWSCTRWLVLFVGEVKAFKVRK